jgi:hypothetical protein
MSTSNAQKSEHIDRIFDEFVYGGLDESEKLRIQSESAQLQQSLSDAADLIRGILADREGREALVKALREGKRDV